MECVPSPAQPTEVKHAPQQASLKRKYEEVQAEQESMYNSTEELHTWLVSSGALEPARKVLLRGCMQDAKRAGTEKETEAFNVVVNQLSLNGSYARLRVGEVVTEAIKHLMATNQLDKLPGSKPKAVAKKAASSKA